MGGGTGEAIGGGTGEAAEGGTRGAIEGRAGVEGPPARPRVGIFNNSKGIGMYPGPALGGTKNPGVRETLLILRGLDGERFAVVGDGGGWATGAGTPELGLELDPGPHLPLRAGASLPGGIGIGGSVRSARTARWSVPAW